MGDHWGRQEKTKRIPEEWGDNLNVRKIVRPGHSFPHIKKLSIELFLRTPQAHHSENMGSAAEVVAFR